MRCINITKPGGPEVLQLSEQPRPKPLAGQVLIEVAAAGINRPDTLQRAGLYRAPAQASPLPGLEVAGRIVEGDLAGTEFKLGDHVCALTPGGAYAEFCVAPATHCMPIPEGLSLEKAAALPETCFTVWSNVFERGQLKAGESLLVHGGSSGIGSTAIQMAHALGHRVIVTVGNEDKARACRELGAEAINYRDDDFAERVNALTDGRGVDVILEMVGGEYIARDIRCLANDGRIVIIGLLGGAKAEMPLAQILLRRLTITGSTLRPRSYEYKAQVAMQLRERIWPLIEAGKIKPLIQQVLPLESAAEAHRIMESGELIGKLVLRV